MSAVPNALFPSDNADGIPTLDLSMQADYLDAPPRGWGTTARAARHRGTWHFYVDDYRFGGIWRDPDQLLRTRAPTAVEVNFSLDDDTPRAIVAHETYRKRWLARYWQSCGIRIFVDLFVPGSCDALNLLGVPAGWRSYATRATDAAIADLKRQARLADLQRTGCGRLDPGLLRLVVYGGGRLVRELCQVEGWTHLTDRYAETMAGEANYLQAT